MNNFWDALNELRLLVFIEDEDNKFRQVILNKKQFKKVSDAIFISKINEEELRKGFEVCEIKINEDKEFSSELFLGMSSFDDNK